MEVQPFKISSKYLFKKMESKYKNKLVNITHRHPLARIKYLKTLPCQIIFDKKFLISRQILTGNGHVATHHSQYAMAMGIAIHPSSVHHLPPLSPVLPPTTYHYHCQPNSKAKAFDFDFIFLSITNF